MKITWFGHSASRLEFGSAVVLIDPFLTGNATFTVTAAGMTGSPKAISVAVALGDSAAVVAQKARETLAADNAVTAKFSVGGYGTMVELTALTAAANDATLNIAIANGTCAGLTAAPTSENTTAGVAPAA